MAAQLTIDGREEPRPDPEPARAPAPEAVPLFAFPDTMRGQLPLSDPGPASP